MLSARRTVNSAALYISISLHVKECCQSSDSMGSCKLCGNVHLSFSTSKAIERGCRLCWHWRWLRRRRNLSTGICTGATC